MAKQTGLGDDFFWAGYHIGNNTASLDNIHGGPAPLEVADITQSAHARLGGLRDGGMQVTVFMDPAAGQEHAAFSPLPTADEIATYCRGQAIGSPAACCVARQLNYDPTRASDGMLTFKVEGQGDGYGLEWGEQLTAGLRTDAAATNGATQNDLAATAFGAQAYLQASAFTGTDATVTIQHSTTGTGSWSTLMSFAQITGSTPLTQRISIANNSAVDQYVRAITTTVGGFSNLAFQVTFVRNKTAGQVF